MGDAAHAEPDPEKRQALWPTLEKLKAEWAEVRARAFPWSLEVTKCAGTHRPSADPTAQQPAP